MGDILYSQYKGKVVSILYLNSVFHIIVNDPETVPLTAFCTHTQLFIFLRMYAEGLEHVAGTVELFKCLHRYNPKLSPGKAHIGATYANFLGHTTSRPGISPDGDKVRALTHMPGGWKILAI